MDNTSLNLGAASDAAVAPPPQASSLEYVGFLRRAGARMIDLAVHLGVAAVVIVFLIVAITIVGAATGTDMAPLLARFSKNSRLSNLIGTVGVILYCSICEGVFGATAGKYLLGMVVLSEDERPCTFGQALARSFAILLDGLFFGLIAFLAMRKSPRQQRRGDQWADTVVVTRASAPRSALRTPMQFAGAFLVAVLADAIVVSVALLL